MRPLRRHGGIYLILILDRYQCNSGLEFNEVSPFYISFRAINLHYSSRILFQSYKLWTGASMSAFNAVSHE
jgi:hypothetical protein